MAGSSFCTACGTPRAPEDAFCKACGHAFAPQQPASADSGMGYAATRHPASPPPSPGSPPQATSGPSPQPVPSPQVSRKFAVKPPEKRRGGARRWLLGGAIVFLVIGMVASLPGLLEDAGSGPGATSGAGGFVDDPSASDDLIVTEPTDGDTSGSSAEPGPTRVKLAAAIKAKQIRMDAVGSGLQSLDIELTSLVDEPLEVVVPVATLFAPRDSDTQKMVVTTQATIQLSDPTPVRFTLDVACATMRRDTPGSSDTFRLSTVTPKRDLRLLLREPAFADASFRVQQFAIWTITDNPKRGSYVGLGTFGVGSGPSAGEFRQIKTLFKKAGIDPTRYAAF